MNSLYMLEIPIDVSSLHHFLHSQGYAGKEHETELGYGIHAWLKAAFGEQAPKPWRLFIDGKRPTRILGYSKYDAKALQDFLSEFADPSVIMVCPEPGRIASRKMPTWQRGRRLGYQVLCCPVGRKAGSGQEKDLFLFKVDEVGSNTRISRHQVYGDWATEKFLEYGVTVNAMELAAFRLVKQIRKTQHNGTIRKQQQIVRPHALLEGELTIDDPERFNSLLAHGLGRHRAFGYGMVLLRPTNE